MLEQQGLTKNRAVREEVLPRLSDTMSWTLQKGFLVNDTRNISDILHEVSDVLDDSYRNNVVSHPMRMDPHTSSFTEAASMRSPKRITVDSPRLSPMPGPGHTPRSSPRRSPRNISRRSPIPSVIITSLRNGSASAVMVYCPSDISLKFFFRIFTQI